MPSSRLPVMLALGIFLLCASLCVAELVSEAQPRAKAPPTISATPPNASTTVSVPSGGYIHFLTLPLGTLDGGIAGKVAFDATGSRVTFCASFPGATIGGDWRTLDPRQAFVLDIARRTLTQLTADGLAVATRWRSDSVVAVNDNGRVRQISLPAPVQAAPTALRLADPESAAVSEPIGEAGDGRLSIGRAADGRYVVQQIGARTLRFEGVNRSGTYALIGNYLVWADRAKDSGAEIAREGPDSLAPPDFSGSAFGDAIVPILPLGHGVYQGGYRDGTAYFAFTYGMHRIIAQTRDLVSFSYPVMPKNPSYTVGDGLGADDSGRLYLGRPENGQVVYWQDNRYVRETLHFPDAAYRSQPLYSAMQLIAPSETFWPPLRPDEDALDTALTQWRIYPVGDAIGQHWIASYLGNLMSSDAAGNFALAPAPRFPFAVLARTDDGRIWGASPLTRIISNRRLSGATSYIWWTRDGAHWHAAGQLPGDAGAIGIVHGAVWVALTTPWMGRAEIALARLGNAEFMPSNGEPAELTGGAYQGEQLFFASLSSGFYLIWGATPGRRLGGDQGTLSAFQINEHQLSEGGGDNNILVTQLLDPSRDPSLPRSVGAIDDGSAFVTPSLQQLSSFDAGLKPVLATNASVANNLEERVIVLSFDQARAYEIKYAARPYPLASVRITLQGGDAVVVRSLARGPLAFEGTTERWKKTADGTWQRTSVVRRWSSEF